MYANPKLSILCVVIIMMTSQCVKCQEEVTLSARDEEVIKDIFGPNPDNPVGLQPTSRPQVLERDGEQCICVPYYLCDPNTKTINNDGSIDGFGVIDIRFNPNTCQDVLDVCCSEGARRTDPIVPATPPPPTPRPPVDGGEPPKPTKYTCGIRNVNGVDFQITGNNNFESQFGEFPWTVALLRNDDDKCQCGGSLIHPQVVLTGAHCVADIQPSGLRVRAGEWDTQTTKERLPYQERQVLRIISHEGFHRTALFNDIALLVLREPVQLAEHIQTVCLPRQDDLADDRDGACVASGWGKKIFGQAGHYQVIMKRVELPVVPNGRCESELRTSRLGHRFRLHDSFMCAGGQKGIDTCEGDGGAPLVCPVPANTGFSNRYQQNGIVAWGIGCGDSLPAVYASVARFRNWIDSHMNNLGFGSEYYTY